MRIYQAENYKAMSRRAANIISAQVIYKPNCVLGLATGGTPVGLYQQLVEWYKKGDLSFAETRSVNLDEYLGCPPTMSRATAISCRTISSTILTSIRRTPTCSTAWPRTPMPSVRPIINSLRSWVALTSVAGHGP